MVLKIHHSLSLGYGLLGSNVSNTVGLNQTPSMAFTDLKLESHSFENPNYQFELNGEVPLEFAHEQEIKLPAMISHAKIFSDELVLPNLKQGESGVTSNEKIRIGLKLFEYFLQGRDHEFPKYFMGCTEQEKMNLFDGLDKKLVSDQISFYDLKEITKKMLELSLPTLRLRIKAAKIAIRYDTDFFYYIRSFDIYDEKALLDIAKIAVKSFPYSLADNIRMFGIENEKFRFELAKELLNTRSIQAAFSKYLENFDISNSEYLVKLARIASQIDASFSIYVQEYGITDQELLVEFARNAAHRYARHTAIYFSTYVIEDSNSRLEIAKIIANKNPIELSDNLIEFNIADKTSLYFLLCECLKSVNSPFDTLKILDDFAFELWRRPKDGYEKIRKRGMTIQKVEKWCKNYFRHFLTLEPLLEMIDSAPKDAYIRLDILKRCILKKDLLEKKQPKNFQEIICVLYDIEEKYMPDDKISSNVKNSFYKVIKQLDNNSFSGVFHHLNIDGKLFQNSNHLLQVIDFLHTLSILLGLEGLENEKREYLKSILKGKRIDLNNIRFIQDEIRSLFVKKLTGVFGFGESNIEYNQLEKLEAKWGSLEAVISLIGRFQASRYLNIELPILGRFLEMCIKESFESYKYEGFSGDTKDQSLAKKQIGFLNKNQMKSWRLNKVLASAHTYLQREQTEKEKIQEIIYISGGKLQVEILRISKLSKDRGLYRESLDNILNMSSMDIRAFERENILSITNKEDQYFVIRSMALELSRMIAEESNFDKILRMITILKFFSGKYKRALSSSALEIIDGLYEFNKANAKSETESSLILSVFSDAPNLLLTIGDSVNVTSCLNYKTGEMVGALLSYVVDANIKAMLSYALGKDDFKNRSDYKRVYERISSGQKIEIQFDGNKKCFRFFWEENRKRFEIFSEQLEYAYLRNIVRVGRSTDGDVAIFKEKSHWQNHKGLQTMREQHKILYDELAREMSAKTEGEIYFPKSRNPGGAYSDAFHGHNVNKGYGGERPKLGKSYR